MAPKLTPRRVASAVLALVVWVLAACEAATPNVTPVQTATSTSTSAVTRPPTARPPSTLADTIYYVSTTGSDANPGTQALPWRTIQKAANTLVAGENVVVNAGNYGERVQVTRSGSAGMPITFLASGSVSMQGFTIRASYITVTGDRIWGRIQR